MHTTHAEMIGPHDRILEAAICALQDNGECAQSVVLFRETQPIVGILVDFRDAEHKAATWQTVVDTACAFGCNAVGLVLDTFCGSPGTDLAPSQDPAAGEALLVSMVFPGSWSTMKLRYGRNDDGSLHFAEKMERGTRNGPLDASMPGEMAQAITGASSTDADEAERLVCQLRDQGAMVGLMLSCA